MAIKKETSGGAEKPYRALSNVRHNGRGYNKGAKLMLNDADAKPLLASKAVKLVSNAGDDESAGS